MVCLGQGHKTLLWPAQHSRRKLCPCSSWIFLVGNTAAFFPAALHHCRHVLQVELFPRPLASSSPQCFQPGV